MNKQELLQEIGSRLVTLSPAAFKGRYTEEDRERMGASSKYRFLPTLDLIKDLYKLGWRPVAAGQQKKRLRRSSVHADMTKHLVEFEHFKESAGIPGYKIRLMITNSHDRSAAFNFHVSVYREKSQEAVLVDNSFFIDGNLEHLRVRHIGYTFEEVKALVNKITKKLPSLRRIVRTFERTKLDEKKQLSLAAAALAIRYPEYVDKKTGEIQEYVPSEVLRSQRPEDNANDLWTTFNKVKENLFRGNFEHHMKNKSKKAKPLTNIRLQLLYGKELWKAAEKFRTR